jgi:hypothetical protein
MVNHVKNMANNRQNTCSNIVNKHGQQSSKRIVKNHQNTWATVGFSLAGTGPDETKFWKIKNRFSIKHRFRMAKGACASALACARGYQFQGFMWRTHLSVRYFRDPFCGGTSVFSIATML